MLKELAKIYSTFFKMGLVTFGGGYAMLPVLNREIVQKHHWLTQQQVIDFYAISQGLPGLIAINVAVFIGYSKNKIAGAVSAALGTVSPCLIIIISIATCLEAFKTNPYVGNALSAISVCVCALILDAIIAMWKNGVKDIFGVVLFTVMILTMVFTKISPILLIILSATSGIIIQSIKEKGEKKQ